MYAQVSAYAGTVLVDMGGSASLRDIDPDSARRLARALILHAEQADILATHEDARNAAVGNRHSRLTLTAWGSSADA